MRTETRAIGRGIVDWIRAERHASNSDRNSYLDHLEEERRRLTFPPQDGGNYMYEKLTSHLQRLPIWLEAFSYDPTNDYQTGKIIFSPLMLLSGCYRERFIFQARDQEDYYAKKRSIGSLEEEVMQGVESRLTIIGGKELDLAHIATASEVCIDLARKQADVPYERALLGEDFGLEESPTVDSTRLRALSWIGFTTDLIVYARQIRGGELPAVPFLEAKSISDDPQVYYPFAA